MDRRSLLAAGAAVLVPIPGRAAPNTRYRVDLLAFVATPKPGVAFDPVERPPFLQALEAGVPIPLTEEAGFLALLGRQAPGYALRSVAALRGMVEDGGRLEFHAPLPPPHLAPAGPACLRATVSVRRATETQVRLLAEGTLSVQTEPAAEPGLWRCRRRYLADLGKAYACEVIGSSAGHYLAIVVGVQAATR